MSPIEALNWIQSTQIATSLRESTWVFPIVLGVHSLGLSLSVGTLLWFDLRLLGVAMRREAVSQVYRQLAPYMLAGFAIMLSSGSLLFAAQASRCYQNVYCRSKLLLLLLPGANALLYHVLTKRGIARWDRDPLPPPAARWAGRVSIISWIAIIVLGRQIVF